MAWTTFATYPGGNVPAALLDDNFSLSLSQGIQPVGSVSGSANAITGTTSPVLVLAANQIFSLVPAAGNTGATTLALNGGTAKNVFSGGAALVGGELRSGVPCFLIYDGVQFNFVQTAAAAVQFIQSGTGASAETVQDELRKGFVYADSYAGASVTAQLDAAILAAAGRVVVIPPTMGAGEPTSVSVSQGIVDLRAGTTLSGKKIVYNASDANGYTRFLVQDDQTSPTLSNAAVLGEHRATGTLPNNRTGEGAQFIGATTGALSNSPSGYTLAGLEASASIGSTGQTLSDVNGLNSNITTESGSTTNITNMRVIYAQAPTKSGTGTITNCYGVYIAEPTAGTNNYGLFSKGASQLESNVDSALNALVVKNAAATATNQYGVYCILSGDPNDNTRYFFSGVGNATERITLMSNGGLRNYQANNANLSDARVKEIKGESPDYTQFVAGLSYKRFRYLDGDRDLDNIVAQDMPEDLKAPWSKDLIGVYEQQLQARINSVIPKLIKRIDELEKKLADLTQ